ncbi:MAG: chemotaxis-specific protein-glutamate methyltransferase CheB [Desulfomonile sp.]|nr:chemotaxis-specific protein-glutamate methyltransferase CheB [Desulfomonile sp.]
MIKVLVVEDSPVAAEFLVHILNSDPEITVMGTARNGVEAIELVNRDKPDVVTMDIIMPRMDGLEATRRIMETKPVPIVVVSASLVREEVDKTFLALEAGAVAALEKPRASGLGTRDSEAEKLIEVVKLMSQVKVIRRWKKAEPAPKTEPTRDVTPVPRLLSRDIKVVAVGASTGGPAVLNSILSSLSRDFPVPILVVQHIAPGFAGGFVDWLNRASPLAVHLAQDGEIARPGCVYVAPDGRQMRIGANFAIALTDEGSETGLRPSVAYLFRSVAESFGAQAVGILLTGMGRDGADDLKLMREKGAVTIAQDKESSVVYGMPGEAAKIGAARYSLPPDKITDLLRGLIK